MTPNELTKARKALGLSAVDFARKFGVTDRTVRAWSNGDSNARPIPFAMAMLVRLAVKYAAVRRELGIKPNEGKARSDEAESEQAAAG